MCWDNAVLNFRLGPGLHNNIKNEWKRVCVLNKQSLSSQNLTSACFCRQIIHQTDLTQSNCKCALLSNQTKQVGLHKHSCLAIKVEWSISLSTTSTPLFSTLQRLFEVIPRGSRPLVSLPAAVAEFLHYQPSSTATIRRRTAYIIT